MPIVLALSDTGQDLHVPRRHEHGAHRPARRQARHRGGPCAAASRRRFSGRRSATAASASWASFPARALHLTAPRARVAASRWPCRSATPSSRCARVEAECIEIEPAQAWKRADRTQPMAIPRVPGRTPLVRGAGRQPQLRQDRAVQPADRRAPEVANYAGVTVERKGRQRDAARRGARSRWSTCPAPTASARPRRTSRSRWVIEGRPRRRDAPDAIVAVVDATNLRMNLRTGARSSAGSGGR